MITDKEIKARTLIIDVVDRYARSIDMKDYDRLETCFTPSCEVVYGGATALENPAAVTEFCSGILSQYTSTQHLLGNYEISIEGNTATASTYMCATHVFPRDEKHEVYIVGGTYDDELVRNGDEWLISKRSLTVLWSESRETV